MSSGTKIFVLHMKEIIYTLIFLAIAAVLAILLYFMFGHGKEDKTASASASVYRAGVYTSTITLSNQTFDVAVTVDTDAIKSIDLINLSETTQAMYPLFEPALSELAEQIYTLQSTENVTYSEETKYTSSILLDAIEAALDGAKL